VGRVGKSKSRSSSATGKQGNPVARLQGNKVARLQGKNREDIAFAGDVFASTILKEESKSGDL
jgi:hypothetical protein